MSRDYEKWIIDEVEEYRELMAKIEAGMCPPTNKWLWSHPGARSYRGVPIPDRDQGQVHIIVQRDKETNECVVQFSEATNPLSYWTIRYPAKREQT